MGLEQPVATVRELDLSPEATERILTGNARSLLGLDGPDSSSVER
jgi:predicted TIM-barrel fold metal-dependent hydrolase